MIQVPLDAALPGFILGFHGCDRSVADRVLLEGQPLQPSSNPYDWLGDGVYFWEHNAQRAFDFAVAMSKRPHPSEQGVRKPAVVGAVIDLGHCLNLLDARYLSQIRSAFSEFKAASEEVGLPLPRNTMGPDRVKRELDCAVIRSLHRRVEKDPDKPRFDTVRSVFDEGDVLYPGSGLSAKAHIQVAVRNPRCVKGYFRPLGPDGLPRVFA